MPDLLTAYPTLVRNATQVALTYRGRLVLGLLGNLFPLLLMAVWLTVVAEGGPPAGWTAGDFLSYYAAAVAAVEPVRPARRVGVGRGHAQR